MNLSKNQLDSLVAMTSKKLGVSENQLRTELQKGTFDRLLATLPKNSKCNK